MNLGFLFLNIDMLTLMIRLNQRAFQAHFGWWSASALLSAHGFRSDDSESLEVEAAQEGIYAALFAEGVADDDDDDISDLDC